MSATNEEQLLHTPSPLQVGLIGNPVAHSYSPRLQQAALDALGIPARYELWQTTADELPARIASLRAPHCLGANVTIPHKEAVLPLLDSIDPLAARIGAVNTIVHHHASLYGYNTDAHGLLHALVEQGIGKQLGNGYDLASTRDATTFSSGDSTYKNVVSLKGYSAVLLGAGGAARSAAFALVQAAVERLIIVNRHLDRAQRLAAQVQQGSHCQVFSLDDPTLLMPQPASLIINATPLGMHAASEQRAAQETSPLTLDVLARFAPDTFVFDMIYNPRQTRLLCQASSLGLRAVNGLPMLLHQGALAFTLWTGQPAPLEVMRSVLF